MRGWDTCAASLRTALSQGKRGVLMAEVRLKPMADIHIRKVDDKRYRELKRQAVDEGVSLKDLVMRLLGFSGDAKANRK